MTSPRKEDRPPHCPTSVNRALHVTGAPGDEPARGRPGPGRPGAGWCCSGDSGLRPPCRARRPATPTRCRPSEEGLRPGAAERVPELVPASGPLPASLARALPPAALVSCAACLCWAPGAALPLPRPLLHDATPHPGWSTSQESEASLQPRIPHRTPSTAAQRQPWPLAAGAGEEGQLGFATGAVRRRARGCVHHSLRAARLRLTGKRPTGKRTSQHPRDGFADPPETLGLRSWGSLVPRCLSIQQAPTARAGPRRQAGARRPVRDVRDARCAGAGVDPPERRRSLPGSGRRAGLRTPLRVLRGLRRPVQGHAASGQGSWTRRSLPMQCDRETPRPGPASATMCKARTLCPLPGERPSPGTGEAWGRGLPVLGTRVHEHSRRARRAAQRIDGRVSCPPGPQGAGCAGRPPRTALRLPTGHCPPMPGQQRPPPGLRPAGGCDPSE